MQKFKIVKRNGRKEYFDEGKFLSALRRSGADEASAQSILNKVLQKLRPGIHTGEIYRLAKKYLQTSHPQSAVSFSLKEAIFRLGPAGYDFEKYIALLLAEHGYATELPDILRGACIPHEVDVVAQKDNERIMVECKLRKSADIYIGSQNAMSTWARWIDLREGARLGFGADFSSAWLVTNSCFSEHALKFGACKGMNMLSWKTPHNMSLPAYIDQKRFYPITALHTVSRHHLAVFSRNNIMLINELIEHSANELSVLTGLPIVQLELIIKEARLVIS